jgi:hypothetical protein
MVIKGSGGMPGQLPRTSLSTIDAVRAGRQRPSFDAVVALSVPRRSVQKLMESSMSNTSAKIALALLLLTAPATSFARMAGQAGAGNVPISGIPPGPANVGGLNNITVDPSGIGNASRMPPLVIPPITVPKVPQFR